MNCIFCKIIAGEIPCAKVYEDEDVLAFLDIAPVNPGHALVIPKNHYGDLLEAPGETLGKLIAAVQKVGRAILGTGEYDSFNVGLNNGQAAGQVVGHLHFHVMPRKEGDGYDLWHGQGYGEGEMEAWANKLRSQIK